MAIGTRGESALATARRLVKVDFAAEMQRIMDRLKKLGDNDISFAEFLERICAGDRSIGAGSDGDDLTNACTLARAFVEGFDAADTHWISAKAVAEEWRGAGNVGEAPQFRLSRGYGSIIEHLLAALPTDHVQVRLNSRVESLRWRAGRTGHVEVLSTSERGDQTFAAPAAIVTVPLSMWHQPADSARAIQFEPDLPEKREAASRLGFGSVVKIVLCFRARFWTESGEAATALGPDPHEATFLHNPGAPFPTWWTMCPREAPMLTAWAGGPAADALAGRSESELIGSALDALAALLDVERRAISGLLVAGLARDWSCQPFVHGAYSYEHVNAGEARERLAQPIDNALYFAGEATSRKQGATVAGALESGSRAARELLRNT